MAHVSNYLPQETVWARTRVKFRKSWANWATLRGERVICGTKELARCQGAEFPWAALAWNESFSSWEGGLILLWTETLQEVDRNIAVSSRNQEMHSVIHSDLRNISLRQSSLYEIQIRKRTSASHIDNKTARWKTQWKHTQSFIWDLTCLKEPFDSGAFRK